MVGPHYVRVRFDSKDTDLGTVGRCIYCLTGPGPFTDEHVLPLGLNGSYVLHEASCGTCQVETSRVELDVLRRLFGQARHALRFRSRRKRTSTTFEALILGSGGEEKREFPIEEFSGVGISFPELAPAPSLGGTPYPQGLGMPGMRHVVNGAAFDAFCRRHQLKGIRPTAQFQPFAFATLLAKVAYGFAVAEHGLAAISDAYVLPAIRGETNDIGQFVGGIPPGQETPVPAGANGHPSIHDVDVHVQMPERTITADVRLFGPWGGPQYRVNVGRVHSNWLPPESSPRVGGPSSAVSDSGYVSGVE